ncbi:MAG TPA: divergent polysaccharide deacetylase family protein [Candidatus Acidoferrum sp.]|jgi:polysaccharide deacetylase 2 family uncharacterized protein YibQ
MVLLFAIFGALGCKQERNGRLTPSQIHQVTQELAKAASDAAPKGTLIKIRRPRDGSAGGGFDEVFIGLHGSAASMDKLLQQFNGIATQHHLTVDAAAAGGSTARMTLRSAGVATHHIEIEISGSRVLEKNESLLSGQPRLAIILDDLGSDHAAAEAIFALHVPITLSVLPYHAHSQEIAREARAHSCEVLLHLPMQSVANESPEQEELRPGLSREETETMVTKMLDSLPEADGVNNHQGSQATANAALMDELMPVLKDAGVFYVDSRTTAATVAYQAAKRDGVKTGFRNVPFLDDVQNSAAVKRQLLIAIHGAKEKGEAIAIGHPHAATLQALREVLPEAKKQGVRLVLVSDVVH